jgi:hypothetical protein
MQQPLTLPGDPSTANQAANKGYVDGRSALSLPLTGGTVTGHVSGITPTDAPHLTRKDYVDGQDALYLPLAGGTVTSHVLGIAPTAAAHLTRKDYVDGQINNTEALFYGGHSAYLRFNPDAVDTAPGSAASGAWLTLGSVDVPDWANTALVQLNICGVYPTTAAACVHLLSVSIGGQGSTDDGRLDFPAATTPRLSTSFASTIDLGGSGAQSVILSELKPGGQPAGLARADTGTIVTCIIEFTS